MRARFVLTRGNNFLGLIANYVTHCVSLNMILSKHSCFGLKQIGIMGSARSRVGIENFNGKQDRYIFIERILEALETLSRHDVCCSFQELWLLKLSNVCTHERTRNYTSPLSLAFFHFSLLIEFFAIESFANEVSSIPTRRFLHFYSNFCIRVSKESCKEMIANFRFEISNFLRHAIFSRISRRLPVQTLILFFNPLF